MWSIQIHFGDTWITLQSGFKSRNDAEWAIGRWKQKNQCYRDPFRAYEQPEGMEDEHDQRAEDEANYQREIGRQLETRM